MIDFLNAMVVLMNYIIVPGLSYGSQLALGALGVSFIYAILSNDYNIVYMIISVIWN